MLNDSKTLYALFFLFVSMGMLGTSALAQSATIDIEGMDTLRFSVTQINAKPGEKVTVKLTNKTSLPPVAMSHNFVLLKTGADPGAIANAALEAKDSGYIPKDMMDKIIAHTGLVAGGETKSVTFNAPKEPGHYTYICTFPGHYAAGMKGTLTIK
ncbi:MAG: plastocyanin/azurin family copper-binding protein [Thermodesulfobacteriota bacterium]